VNNAYECKEVFTPDGKRLVRRERTYGNSLVRGVIAVVAVIAIVVLVLTGHATMSIPVSLPSLTEWVHNFWRK
jgi:hypothetical protein